MISRVTPGPRVERCRHSSLCLSLSHSSLYVYAHVRYYALNYRFCRPKVQLPRVHSPNSDEISVRSKFNAYRPDQRSGRDFAVSSIAAESSFHHLSGFRSSSRAY
jgi:hypothetical protein